MALVPIEKLNLNNLTSIENLLIDNEPLSVAIDETAKQYHRIDIGLTMKKLEKIAEILKLAYAGSKGFSCSETTIEILCRYQTMITNTCTTSDKFVNGCLSALNYHKFALITAEKGKIESTLKFLQKCSDVANNMSEECQKLVDEASNLSEMSQKALIAVQHDENISLKDKNDIDKMINEAQAKKAENDAKIKILHDQIDDYKQQQADLAKKADLERARNFYLNIISTSLVPVNKAAETASNLMGAALTASNVIVEVAKSIESLSKDKNNQDSEKSNETKSSDNSASASLVEQENLIIKLKNELQKEEREANAKLVEYGELLKGYKNKDQDLTASILSLNIAIIALGKIRTTFEHTKRYWLGVKTHCENLAKIDILIELNQDPTFKDEFIIELKKSALNWMALGKNNYLAQKSIEEVSKKNDSIMSNLPDKIKASKILKYEADTILNELIEETSIL